MEHCDAPPILFSGAALPLEHLQQKSRRQPLRHHPGIAGGLSRTGKQCSRLVRAFALLHLCNTLNPFSLAGQFANHLMWCSEKTGIPKSQEDGEPDASFTRSALHWAGAIRLPNSSYHLVSSLKLHHQKSLPSPKLPAGAVPH